MNGEFLQGLGRGIFGEMGRMRQDQEKKDEKRKGEVIDLLTSLAPQIEPESLPLLMGHIGDTIGIKGKMRKFWDVFSGTPDPSPEAQYGNKLREITSQLTGPESAKKARAGGDMARLFQPQTPEQESNRSSRLQTESDLSNKLIFRDPRAEKQEDLKTQYGLKFAQQDSMLQEKERLLRARQEEDDQRGFQNAWKLNQQRSDLKAEQETQALATTLARAKGFTVPNTFHLTEAAKQIATKYGLNLDLLKARIGLAEARTDEAQANATFAGQNQGLNPTQVMQQRRFDKDQQKEFRSLQSELTDLQSGSRSYIDKISRAKESIDAWAKTRGGSYDPNTGQLNVQPELKGTPSARKMMQDYEALLAEEQKAKGAMKAKSDQIRTQFSEFLKPGGTEWDPVELRKEYGGVAPAGAPRSGAVRPTPPQPPRPGPQAGLKGTTNIPIADPSKYEVGGRIKFQGKWYRITSLKGNFIEGLPE